MVWILAIAATAAILTLLIAAGRRRSGQVTAHRDAPLNDALTLHLQNVAAHARQIGTTRVRMSTQVLRGIERAAALLCACDERELLPAGRWVCDNARFLQEEAADAVLCARRAPKLPCGEDGAPRVVTFAGELISHCNADLTRERLCEAVAAWQQAAPFTNDELAHLPLALRAMLLTLVCELADACAARHQAQRDARQVTGSLPQSRRAMRLFMRHRNETAFLQRLVSELRTKDEPEALLWLERYLRQHGVDEEELTAAEEKRQSENCLWMGNAITSLRTLQKLPWHKLLEDMSAVHALLLTDETYPAMDAESRAAYRTCAARIARSSGRPEQAVCAEAISLCTSAPKGSVRSHVGYYLLDAGRATLLQQLGAKPRIGPKGFCGAVHAGSPICFALLLWAASALALPMAIWTPFAWVFTCVYRQIVHMLSARFVPPRPVPRMQVDELSKETQTLVVCPTLMTDAKHAIAMVKRLSVLHQANPDPHLHFLLLGDPQDSLTASLPVDEEIIQTAATAIRALREDTGHPFYYLHRERVFDPRDQLHISRERKRGSLETLFRLIEGQPTEEGFAYADVDPEALKGRYRYVITLDSDTLLPPGSALRMVGAMLHPLQRRMPAEDGHMRGVSILQPRMQTAAHTVGSLLGLALGGPGGTDPYNALTADFYRDACGRSTFVGKGIIDPKGFLAGTEGNIVPGAVLSHDLLEGELCGCIAASDIVLYDGEPSTLKGFLYRLHRWTRGDWQLLPYVLPIFPAEHRPPRGVVDGMARHKMRANLYDSLVGVMRIILLVYAACSAHRWLFWCALLLPEVRALLPFTLHGALSAACRTAALPCTAGMQLDAIARTLYRLFVSRQRLLQWTTAAQMADAHSGAPMQFFYLNMISAAVFFGLSFLPGAALWLGAGLSAAWAALPALLPFLEQPYHSRQRPTEYMREVLGKLARETLLFFETAITDEDNALPPDNVQIDPNKGVSHRTSPTNIGLYLCSLIAAEKLRLLSADEMARRMQQTVATLEALPKWRGHLYNWYDTRTLQPLKPGTVSSVDSGNLVVCLLSCAQGIRVLLPRLPAARHDLAARLDALAHAVDLAALFDPEAELFYVGMDVERDAPTAAHYDLLASESRLLSFAAVMLGSVPLRHWYRLGRMYARTARGDVLLSYSGTMFEYMMPLLFQPPVRGTLLYSACRAALRVQRMRRLGGAFGVSESGYYAFDPDLYYQYRAFGLPQLALSTQAEADVLTPYATLLCLGVDLKAAFTNVLKLQMLGLEGPMGFFEAADFAPSRTEGRRMRIVRSHMAHHQGMILCAVCNALEEGYIASLFTSLPRVEAYQLLNEERPGRAARLIRHTIRRPQQRAAAPSAAAKRHAAPMRFPIDAHVLHGAGATVMVDAQGGGYLSRDGVMLTRFCEWCDVPCGPRFYLRDSVSGGTWCVTDPALCRDVVFENAQAVFRHARTDVETELRVFVDPLDGAVIHVLTLSNTGAAERMMEICSYLEPALAPQRDDAAHPAFGNLFIRTSRLGRYGVEAVRRARGAQAQQRRLWHMMVTNATVPVFHIHTDRTAFIGRGRSVYAPRIPGMPIGSSADRLGDMIEPCLSLHAQFTLPSGGTLRFAFITLCPEQNDTPERFEQRYATPDAAIRCYDPALTRAVITARYLGMDEENQNIASRLVGALTRIGQPHQFRHAAGNALPLSELWPMGISGDLPVLLLECGEGGDLGTAAQLLKAHAYHHASGLWYDLVLASRNPTEALRTKLTELARAVHPEEMLGCEGGIHMVACPSDAQLALLRAAARLVLDTCRGSIDAQLRALQSVPDHKPVYALRPAKPWKTVLPPEQDLLLDNGFGGFTRTEGDYVITLPPGQQTPAPWCNPLCSQTFGTLAGESGPVFSYAHNSHDGRLTRWPNDSVSPLGGENFFLRDERHRLLWSVTRQPLGHMQTVRITHSPGVTTYESTGFGLSARLQCFSDEGMGVRILRLTNDDSEPREVSYFHTCAFCAGSLPGSWQLTYLTRFDGGLTAHLVGAAGVAALYGVDVPPNECDVMSSGAFSGLWGMAPAALTQPAPESDCGNVGLLCYRMTLAPGESRTVTTALIHADTQQALACAADSLRRDGGTLRLHAVRQMWEDRLGALRFDLPDPALNLMLSRWLPYQVRAARLWMRAGFYQAGGAFGFRDQLQDMLALMHTEPARVREHLLLCAAHQFEEGDVQHWWHPPQRGVRTRISDDLLFLPFITAIYVHTTGDTGVLHQSVAYLHAAPLAPDEHERYDSPACSALHEPLWQHCVRAIDHVRTGVHGLPLMGGGDWNDGMNAVGGEQGESVWLGMFLCEVLRRFAPLCDTQTAQRLGARRTALMQALEAHAWDGEWYLRAWYDDGSKLGSATSTECRIDSLPQTWAVMAGISRDRCAAAMEHVWHALYERDAGILKLFTPPFDGEEQPGYIAGYLPGVRENGGQYTHAVPWAIAAYHQLGQDHRAWELVNAVLPVHHAATRSQAMRYRVEPYVLAGDVYANPQQRGRGGWTWYTGSASWLGYVVLTELLGFQKQGSTLRLRPVAPPHWNELRITYRYGTATYHLRAARDCPFPSADGEQLREGRLLLKDDGRIHEAVFPLR